ncbi:hypothetical protein LTR37_009544 [Vermiconidia calcicola]|uniref:Uncharacterized protein n=1 Tax=Vermiconidia calcicola TaxID=1690605 RepID=A0ACC3N7C6_9PEZI|nr:hypothetical protein LTR37_009544 [Vermiconidia calcicola]
MSSRRHGGSYSSRRDDDRGNSSFSRHSYRSRRTPDYSDSSSSESSSGSNGSSRSRTRGISRRREAIPRPGPPRQSSGSETLRRARERLFNERPPSSIFVHGGSRSYADDPRARGGPLDDYAGRERQRTDLMGRAVGHDPAMLPRDRGRIRDNLNDLFFGPPPRNGPEVLNGLERAGELFREAHNLPDTTSRGAYLRDRTIFDYPNDEQGGRGNGRMTERDAHGGHDHDMTTYDFQDDRRDGGGHNLQTGLVAFDPNSNDDFLARLDEAIAASRQAQRNTLPSVFDRPTPGQLSPDQLPIGHDGWDNVGDRFAGEFAQQLRELLTRPRPIQPNQSAHPPHTRGRLLDNGRYLPANIEASEFYLDSVEDSNRLEAIIRDYYPSGVPPADTLVVVHAPDPEAEMAVRVVNFVDDEANEARRVITMDAFTVEALLTLIERTGHIPLINIDTLDFSDFRFALPPQAARPAVPPTSRRTLATLGTRRLLPSDLDDEGKVSCSICLDEKRVGVEVTVLPCGHFFDRECINTWLETNGSCPTCRRPVET